MKRISRLAILQLEQYDKTRYLASISRANHDIIPRIRWTMRLKLTSLLSYLLGIVGANMLIGSLVKAAETITWYRTRKQIARLKKHGLKVVAIAGSYGKTSVKNYAYDLLRTKFRTVATPESYNTVFGIAKCLQYEVDTKTEVFIVEVGAYRIGDIAYLLDMVQSELGVLTGMARQHLERFGNWENIQTAKMEIADYMKQHGFPLVANASDEAVVKNVEKLGVKTNWYRGKDRREINLNGAITVAKILGVSETQIKNARLREPKNRFEMTRERYGMWVIDDSFSSNDVGFGEAVKHLGKQTKYIRILVTPGLVELGSESDKIHEQLGKGVIGKADYVMLVGRNRRTQNLELGMGGKIPVIYIDKTLDFMQAVNNLKLKKEPLVLLENDVTENY